MRLRTGLRAAAGCAAAGLMLCGCSLGQSQNAILVDADSTGGATRSLDPFTVTGPWQITYNFDCSKQDSEAELNTNQFTVDVFNGDDNSTAFEHPQTTFIAVKRRGSLNFKRAGDYYLHVDSPCDWTLQVVDLSGGVVASATAPPRIPRPHGTVTFDWRFDSWYGVYNCGLTGTAAALCVVADGTVGTSQFGALSLHRMIAAQVGTERCGTASTTATLTAANGDVLNLRSDKEQWCTGPRVGDTDSFTVTGGTGIFKGATGSGTIISHGGRPTDRWRGSITFAP